MVEFTYEEQGESRFLVYEKQADDVTDTMSLGMISNNKIAGLVPFVYVQVDDHIYMKYNISGLESLQQHFSETVNKKKLLETLESLADALIRAEDYMLEVSTFILDPAFLYINASTNEVSLVALPIEREGDALVPFLRQLIFGVRYDQSENGNYIAALISFFNTDKPFSIYEFRKLVQELKAENSFMQGSSPKLQTEKPQAQVQPIGGAGQQSGMYGNSAQQPVQQQYQSQGYGGTGYQPQGGMTANDNPTTLLNQQGMQQQSGMQMQTGGGYGQQTYWQQPYQSAAQGNINNTGRGVPYPYEGETQQSKAQPAGKKEKRGLFGKKEKPPKKEKAPKPEKEKKGLFGRKSEKKEAKEDKKEKKQKKQGKDPASANRLSGIPIPGKESYGNAQGGGQPEHYEKREITIPAQDVKIEKHQAPPQNIGETVDLKHFKDETTLLSQTNAAAAPVRQIAPHLYRCRTGEVYWVTKELTRIGRNEAATDICIVGNTIVGRLHAVLYLQNDEFYLQDNHSKNGTYVDGMPLQPGAVSGALRHGTKIVLGDEELEFRMYP